MANATTERNNLKSTKECFIGWDLLANENNYYNCANVNIIKKLSKHYITYYPLQITYIMIVMLKILINQI